MFATFFQGLALSAAMIIPIGPQNALVMNQGIQRQYHLMIAGLCAVCDIVLIFAGIFGGSVLLSQSPTLLLIVSWGGVAFLLWFGWGAFRAAFKQSEHQTEVSAIRQSRWRVVASMLAVTWLNPHVYLDTFVVLGSLGGRLSNDGRVWFALGAVTASIIWFFGLAILASLLSPWLNTAKARRIINLVVGTIMWVIVLQLVRQTGLF